jgi:hypothetical protein
VLNNALTNLRDVQDAVQEIRGLVEVSSAISNVVAKYAHAL